MSDASRPLGRNVVRPLRDAERRVVAYLLGAASHEVQYDLERCMVTDLRDGGMGSLRFVSDDEPERSFGRTIAEAEYLDADDVPVSIALSLDGQDRLYEVDFWKVNFSPLLRYPVPEQLKIKTGPQPQEDPN
jgi:hypothetical protein